MIPFLLLHGLLKSQLCFGNSSFLWFLRFLFRLGVMQPTCTCIGIIGVGGDVVDDGLVNTVGFEDFKDTARGMQAADSFFGFQHAKDGIQILDFRSVSSSSSPSNSTTNRVAPSGSYIHYYIIIIIMEQKKIRLRIREQR
jgi:hypothetical protein